ncbi:hypothetical protein RA29_19280 [Tateyamaria sp. ANG-S1]|nr:hypothetical protein RA29_19280 [Tateyamaria sp. ANG-S1]
MIKIRGHRPARPRPPSPVNPRPIAVHPLQLDLQNTVQLIRFRVQMPLFDQLPEQVRIISAHRGTGVQIIKSKGDLRDCRGQQRFDPELRLLPRLNGAQNDGRLRQIGGGAHSNRHNPRRLNQRCAKNGCRILCNKGGAHQRPFFSHIQIQRHNLKTLRRDDDREKNGTGRTSEFMLPTMQHAARTPAHKCYQSISAPQATARP